MYTRRGHLFVVGYPIGDRYVVISMSILGGSVRWMLLLLLLLLPVHLLFECRPHGRFTIYNFRTRKLRVESDYV